MECSMLITSIYEFDPYVETGSDTIFDDGSVISFTIYSAKTKLFYAIIEGT
jgi:hypothetical protein